METKFVSDRFMETKVLGYIVVALIIGLVIGYPLGTMAAPTKIERVEVPVEVHPLEGKTIWLGHIGASVTGMEWEEPTIEIALEDVNNYCKSIGLNVTFKAYIECAEGSAVKALEKMQSLYAKGVRFITGMRWSSHCKACLEYANDNDIIMISDGSTSPKIAIPGDNLFRLPPTDLLQGPAMARMLWDYGIRAVAVLQRADDWGDGLYAAFKDRFEELGGTIIEYIRYDPEKTEFSAEISTINDAVAEAIQIYGQNAVTVEVIGFEEISIIQATAKDYPALMSIPWFGNDGYVRSTKLLEEQPDTALAGRHFSTYAGITKSEVYEKFEEKFVPKVGYVPGTYACYLYDSIWIFAKAILETGSTDPKVVKEAIPRIAASYFGASGWCNLNEDGDRAVSIYNIWAVYDPAELPNPEDYTWQYGPGTEQYGPGKPNWVLAGVYDPLSDSVTWFVPIPAEVGLGS